VAEDWGFRKSWFEIMCLPLLCCEQIRNWIYEWWSV